MFVYLIELLGVAYVGIRISWWRNLIINIIKKGWKYIIKILVFGLAIVIISIYPLLFYNNTTDILFAYLYELLFISISWILLSELISGIFTLILRIIRKEWKYIIKQFIISGLTSSIILLAYLLADGSIDPKSLKYGVTEIISKIVGTGMILVVVTSIGLILPGIIVLEIRGLVMKYSN